MSLIEMKTATITEKGQIAIPKDIRKLEGFSKGKKIVVLAFDDHIELRSLEQVQKKIDFTEEKMFPAIASEKSLAKDWLSKEDDQAWKNL
jgi:AbrB family looped-hinge helix DNA binding protein